MAKQPTPQVWIDGINMESHAYEAQPVLAGMNLEFGADSDTEMEGPATCALSLLIKQPTDLSFIELGRELVIFHDPEADAMEPAFTYFVGRIQRATALPDEERPGALRVSISASDTTTDLENELVPSVSSPAVLPAERLAQLQEWSPDVWDVINFEMPFPAKQHAAMTYHQEPFLDLLDAFCRGQLLLRTNQTYWLPGSGTERNLVLVPDLTRYSVPDQLTRNELGGWDVVVIAAADKGQVAVRLEASNVYRDVEWVKEPDDLITEVSLQRLDPPTEDDDSKRTPITSRLVLDTAALRAAVGVRTVEFDTDLPAGGPVEDIKPIFEHWISDKSAWRCHSLSIVDSEQLPMSTIGLLLSTTRRRAALVAVRGTLDNRPDTDQGDVRGTVLSAKATWNGTKWEIELKLSRSPSLPAGGDWWTFDKFTTAQGGKYATDTCASIGDAVTFADFKRIGTPIGN